MGHLTDPGGNVRHDKAWHLVLRCLFTKDVAFSGQVKSTPSSVVASAEEQLAIIASLRETTRLIQSDSTVAAALFDLFVDVLLYTPVPASSSLLPSGLSESGCICLIGGAASEQSGGCARWKEEFASMVGLRKLKLKLLDLVAPCRLHALFFPERKTADGNDAGVGSADDHRSMGIAPTVALMVLLAGDSDPDVRNKAESYLRSHMDTYRGKEVGMDTKTIHDALLGNSVGLARTILTLAIGGTITYYGKSPPPPSAVLSTKTKTTVMTHANYTYRPRRICTSTYNVYPPRSLRAMYALPSPRGPIVVASVLRLSRLSDIVKQIVLRLVAAMPPTSTGRPSSRALE